MEQKKARLSRRNFLLTVGAGGAAGAAAIAARKGAAPAAKSEAPRTGQGYQVTEHVNNYYRTAKV
ncbi:MAG TPA: formate dehydrogenase [Burkholderiales bacterium]|nr:formate dehydrogenase [Burkholderiales bacterium]